MFDWFDGLNVATDAAPAAATAADSFYNGGTNDIAQFLARDNGTAGFGGLGSFAGTSDASMADLFNTAAPIGSGMGDALGFSQAAPGVSGGGDFLSTLASQLGDKFLNPKDPLSSLTNIVGALGAVRNIMGKEHSDMGQVQKLFDKANDSPYKAANTIQAKAPLRGRAPGQFIAPTGALTLIKRG